MGKKPSCPFVWFVYFVVCFFSVPQRMMGSFYFLLTTFCFFSAPPLRMSYLVV